METTAVNIKKKWETPSGWAIKAYKHLNVPSADFHETNNFFIRISQTNQDVIDGNRAIAYGNFDRIQLRPVDSFASFSSESNLHNWFGSSQSILLYSWPDKEGDRVFQWEPEHNRFRAVRVINRNGNKLYEEQKDSFFAISFCYISDWVRNSHSDSFQKMLNECNNRILDHVKEFNRILEIENSQVGHRDNGCVHEPVLAEVFGSLSTAELVILWSAKQYADILYLVDSIRDLCWAKSEQAQSDIEANEEAWINSEHGVFRTTYTMVSFPELIASEIDDSFRQRVRAISGHSYIQFATQDTAGENSFELFRYYMERCLKNAAEFLGENIDDGHLPKLKRSAGEYDLIAEVKSKYLPPLFCYPPSMQGKDQPIADDNKKEFSFNVHHPSFNRYILYTTTRLTYEPSDLPLFAQNKGPFGQDWKKWRKKREPIIGSGKEGVIWKRSERIKKIYDERKKEFQKMMGEIRERVPAVSNLSLELKQLFSDYIQCCCSSADYLWIDDFDELFQQMMKRVSQSVEGISVCEDGGIDQEAWNDARRTTDDLSKLVRALHQQISHISTSNKLFFREQETHFGYTAQHDLIIHAFYDIIKRLIGYIYSYTDQKRQSFLFPLVNFQAENRIVSKIYTEETEDFFTKCWPSKIRPRIMVIRIPLDGVENLMYYLPMLVHEVYHYAAPRERELRNLYLAKVVIDQTLRVGFMATFTDFALCVAKEGGFKRVDNTIIKDRMGREFDRYLSPIIYRFICENEGKILKGLKEYYFQNAESEEKQAEFMNHSILRRWFTNWLQQWLCDAKKREREAEGKNAVIPDDRYENLSDLYPNLFPQIIRVLREVVEENKKADLSEYEKVFYNTLKEYQESMERSLNSSETADPNNDGKLLQCITQEITHYADDSYEYKELLKQLDEIMPDMAMVTTVGMPASGYMLQTALDLDKQFFGGREFVTDHIRFGAVLHWLLKKKVGPEPVASDVEKVREKEKKFWEKIDKTFKEEKQAFKKLYLASYRLVTQGYTEKNSDREEARILKRAEVWCVSFQLMYDRYVRGIGAYSICEARSWIDSYIEKGMVEDSLKLMDAYKLEERRKCFEEPYHQYLEILNRDTNNDNKEQSEHQLTLFALSIQTILKFQRHQTLKDLNKLLPPERRDDSNGGEETANQYSIDLEPRLQYRYSAKVTSMDQYEHTIQMALDRLYQYREADGLSEATGMWYRGVSHAEYPVLPSGFVHFGEDAGRLNNGVRRRDKKLFSFLESVQHHYETFRYAAEGSSPDISPSQYYNTFNYLTLMQHYRQHTNLLDWSEDFFAATYFALEDEININDLYEYEQQVGKREKHLPNREADAALYILDPLRFNIACQQIEEAESDKKIFDVKSFELGLVRANIPNLSINENRTPFAEYYDLYRLKRGDLQGIISVKSTSVPMVPNKNVEQDISLKHLREYRFTCGTEANQQIINFHLPRAVYAAKLNSRIRAQSGLFVAFSLKSVPAVWNNKDIPTDAVTPGLFNYQALEKIQDYYMDVMGKNPFIMKIIIPASMKQYLGELYYELGLSKERIYPEMDNQRNR